MRCFLSEWQSPSPNPSQVEPLPLSMSRTFASIIDILQRVLNGPNVFPQLRRWAHSEKHTNWKRSFCKWFVICIPGWVHLRSWKRKHDRVFKIFFRTGKMSFSVPKALRDLTAPKGSLVFTVAWCPLMGEPFLRHLIHRWETMFYYLREALNSIKSSCCLDSTFLKVWVTFPHYSTSILNGVKPNHLEQRPTKWVEVVVRVMQMSPERFLEIHTLWDLSPFPIAYPANRTNLTLGGALE